MNKLHDFARRKPETVAAAAFLWGPAVLIAAEATRDSEIIIPALLLAAGPYAAILLWVLWSAVKEAPMIGKLLLLIALATIIALSVNWEAPLQY